MYMYYVRRPVASLIYNPTIRCLFVSSVFPLLSYDYYSGQAGWNDHHPDCGEFRNWDSLIVENDRLFTVVDILIYIYTLCILSIYYRPGKSSSFVIFHCSVKLFNFFLLSIMRHSVFGGQQRRKKKGEGRSWSRNEQLEKELACAGMI